MIFCFPVFVKGFGMPIIEANYVGIPVITNLSPMKEIARNSSLFDPYKPYDLKISLNYAKI